MKSSCYSVLAILALASESTVGFSVVQVTPSTSNVIVPTNAAATSPTTLFAKPTSTQLGYRVGEEEVIELYTSTEVKTTAFDLPPSLERPVRLEEVKAARVKQVAVANFMLSTEMAIGRIAMISAVALLGTELILGQSIPEQIASMLN
eukprot:CAMPEP_0194046910 /NCGR_PEP_ID=MMETSP0009_2-20130614/22932_1 /TAXON_ID=210454 /ORGANISM="Grammatophora oceanica, Strain CCMP 410" /LENGTH=147 /DNA_ID=CAMNT_0038692377 /DNA_START=52 /DNA_END=495 /DNA_ORIENTATION=+